MGNLDRRMEKMKFMEKLFTALLAVSVMAIALPRTAEAGVGGPEWGTGDEASGYGQLEKSAPELGGFVGGQELEGVATLLALALMVTGAAIVLVFSVFYWMFTGDWLLSETPGPEALDPEAP